MSMFSIQQLDYHVVDLLIYIVTKIYERNKEFHKYYDDLVGYIHNECTLYFFSIISQQVQNHSTTVFVLQYFAFFLFFEHDNKDLLSTFDDYFFMTLSECAISNFLSYDLFTSKVTIDLIYQLSRFPNCIQHLIDNGIIQAISDFLLDEMNQIVVDESDDEEKDTKNKKYLHQKSAQVISNINNYETIPNQTSDTPSLFSLECFPDILINELNSCDPVTRSCYVDFITNTIPDHWNYYLDKGIINIIIDQLSHVSFSEKRYILRAFIIFLSCAPSDINSSFINDEIINEFELYLDPEFYSSSEELCQTLLDILTPDLIQILQNSSFPNALEEFIDKSPISDCAEELMSYINGEEEDETL